MDIKKLKKIALKLPKSPGVYTFLVKGRKPLYIGKALNLHSRVLSYIHTMNHELPATTHVGSSTRGRRIENKGTSRATDPRLSKMIELAHSIKHIRTASDIEALILEAQLIKLKQPLFNIRLRDGSQYFYVEFTNDQLPRVIITHQIQGKNKELRIENKGFQSPYSSHIGPFTDGTALKTTLKLLRRIFPYCTCKQKHHVRCLNAHMELCQGFCCLRQQNPELGIKNKELREYGKNITAIRDILSGKRKSVIKKIEKEMVSLGDKGELEEALAMQGKIKHLKRIFENARVIEKTRIKNKELGIRGRKDSLKQLQHFFQLEHLPQRIEGYDIANIQGEYAVGSMVVFTTRSTSSGQVAMPDKKQYRLFNIKTVHESNDTAMLAEMLERRFNHPEWPYPDLIIVDGGKAQLATAQKVLSELRIKNKELRNIPVIALTKDKKHKGSHVYWQELRIKNKELRTIPLKRLPEQGKNLILNVDAEAHRFAISAYRKRHRKNLTH